MDKELGYTVTTMESSPPTHIHGEQCPASEADSDAPPVIPVIPQNPAELSPKDIQDFVRNIIDGPGIALGAGPGKKFYKVREPPEGMVVRIYADGVYDLFHPGHMLQLRQAKLSFPPETPDAPCFNSGPVYLIAGVHSDAQCIQHKAQTVMSHAERCESVRHCKWVDEVVPDAPWVIDQDFLDKYEIDYVVHDEDPYVSAGYGDVYAYCKSQGRFLPTRRTPGISTSDLLARFVSQYRKGMWDETFREIRLAMQSRI